MTTTASFAELKKLVSIQHVLARRQLLDTLQHRSRRLTGPCPIHAGDNPRAFVVDLVRDLWFCFTRCRRGGDVVDLVRLLDASTYAEAASYLTTLASTTPSTSPRPIPLHPSSFRPFSRRLHLHPADPFLLAKRIRPQTASFFDAGRFHGPGWLEGCLAVRLHDHQGTPLGYAGRHLDADKALRYGKWKLPPRFPRSSTLYNLHRVHDRLPHGVVLVECPWAVMRLHQIGIPALALLGTELSPQQRHLLRHATRILLLMDGDLAGRQAAHRIDRALSGALHVSIARLPDGLDPDDLDDDRLRQFTHILA
jgi:DNA primase